MNKQIKTGILAMLGLLTFVASYTFIAGVPPNSGTVVAHSSEMPAVPHVLYLAPENSQRGEVNDSLMVDRVLSRSEVGRLFD